MEPTRTIWTWLADWFAVRRPTRLVVDGLFILFWSGVTYLLWALWYAYNQEAILSTSSRLDKNLSITLSALHSTLLYLGLVFIAVGCSRIIAEGRPTPPAADNPSPPTP